MILNHSISMQRNDVKLIYKLMFIHEHTSKIEFWEHVTEIKNICEV